MVQRSAHSSGDIHGDTPRAAHTPSNDAGRRQADGSAGFGRSVGGDQHSGAGTMAGLEPSGPSTATGSVGGGGDGPGRALTSVDLPWEEAAGDARLLARYIGQANIQTDIKEAVFLGQDDALVAAGSDGGRVFIFDAATGEAVMLLHADDDVANCVQCHPTLPVLATSGIESVVRVWAPTGTASAQSDLQAVVEHNQRAMREPPEVSGRISPGMLRVLTDNPDLLAQLPPSERTTGVMRTRRRRAVKSTAAWRDAWRGHWTSGAVPGKSK